MHLALAIAGSIFAIFIIIVLHEFGHFIAARLCGVRVLRFAIGFGKPLWKYISIKSGTEYALGWLPLGGYVKMLGETEEALLPEEAAHAYNTKPLWQRMVIVLAGPLVNFILALLAFYAVYLMGVQHIKPVVGSVVKNSIVAQAGIKAGDEIIKVGHESTQNWQQVLLAVVKHTGDKGQLAVTILTNPQAQPVVRQLTLTNWHLSERSPEFLNSLGFVPYEPAIPAVITQVVAGSPAATAGLKAGDKVVALNGRPIKDWPQLATWVQAHPNQRARLTLLSGTQRFERTVAVGSVQQDGKQYGHIGVMVQPPPMPANMIRTEHFGVLSAWVPAYKQTWALIKLNFIVTAKMLTGKVSLKSLGGPVTIFRAAGQATQLGWQVYLGFIAFISLAIGYLNLLPIPGLDGGHFLFQVIEGIIRRPVPERVQSIGFSIGMVFLVFLMVQATINDLIRLF